MQVTGAQRAAIAFLRDDVNCCWAAVLALLAKYSFGLAAGVSDACTREAAQVHTIAVAPITHNHKRQYSLQN
jgi:hypothetical protein